jgi:catechol 2,3-dioxygenase-like lactoylglutathione lyase family enzyme
VFHPHHVALSVSDLDRSIEFYRVFGFKLKYQYESPDGDRNIAHLHLGNMFLELFCYRNHSLATKDTDWEADLRAIGNKHFGLRVESVQEVFVRLKASGHLCTATRRGLTGMDYFFVRDPDGIWMEIVQDDRASA